MTTEGPAARARFPLGLTIAALVALAILLSLGTLLLLTTAACGSGDDGSDDVEQPAGEIPEELF